MSNSQLRALGTDDIAILMSASDIAVLNAEQVAGLTTVQVRAIESADIGALSAGDLQEFTVSQVKVLDPAADQCPGQRRPAGPDGPRSSPR